jgi:hypothetical protein
MSASKAREDTYVHTLSKYQEAINFNKIILLSFIFNK